MKFPVIIVPFLPASGMALFPFILLKYAYLKNDRRIINHEKIHLRQQLELLIVPFYILYILQYLINILYYGNHHKAYKNIVFEKEAYEMDGDLSYLNNRKLWSWIKFLR